MKFYSGDVHDLMRRLQQSFGRDVFIDGGSETIDLFLKEEMIDEIILSIVPVLLGDGIPLFRQGRKELKLQLTGTRQYDSGLVQLHYSR